MNFTACYTTESETLSDCRNMLIDAASEMAVVTITPPSNKFDTSPSQGRPITKTLRPLLRGREPFTARG